MRPAGWRSWALAALIGALAPAPPATGQSDGPEAVRLPALDALEPAVAAQIREEGQRVAAVARAGARQRAEAYGELARVLHVYEFFEPAEASYVLAARLAPADGRWPHLLGYLYEQSGRLDEAVAQFTIARRVQPGNRAASIRLADVLLRLNRLREAREEFDQAAQVFPALAQSGLGEVALREGRYRDAVRHFEAALERVPTATSLHYLLAMAHRGLGRLDRAQAHLQKRGTGVVRVGDPIVDGLQALVRGERGLVMQGRRAYDAGAFADAAAAFARAVEAAPRSATPRVNLGLARQQLGDTAGAVVQFEAALQLDPANQAAHAGLGGILAAQRRDQDALPHLQAASDQAPEDASLGRQLVGTLTRLGRTADAIAVLERMGAADGDDEDALLGLVLLLSEQGRLRDALVMLSAANRRFPERTATATTLARVLASAPDRALRDGRRALELATAVHASDATPVHAETVAMSLAELGRCEEARTWMATAVAAAAAARDAAEASRLRGLGPQYSGASCLPPGR